MVHFVGAGCGAVDLITVRGQRQLQEADVVIYAGSLVNEELLTLTKDGAEIYNSAKMTLEEVMEVMVAAANENKTVVRLHTGDSSIYGAIKEQMVLLEAHKIPYDVTPGVSAFCGAAASLKAEYTLPDVSQTVIITRMQGKTPVPERESMVSLARHQASMVIFLSTGLLKELSKELIEGGYAPETPAAIVYKASWKDEKICHCTVATLYETAKQENITKTALITVGRFLGDEFSRSKLYDPSFTTEFRKAKNPEESHES